jgi:hypothetical protein
LEQDDDSKISHPALCGRVAETKESAEPRWP